MALVAAALALAASAQQPDQFVMHLYVDPIYGNDPGPLGVNEFFNPDGTGPECTAQTVVGPHSVQLAGPGSGTAPLFHAPYPFKTITAAIAYVTRLSPGAQPLPHTDPTTGLTWSHCIIHLLPGWYGRSSANIFNNSRDPFTGTHKASRLVPNGETFPLHIPPRVSLAGTSALNTILDLGMVGTAIEFGKVVSGIALSGEETFIDKITFYACGGWQPTVPAPEPDPRKCAAILIDDEMRCGVTITNCVFLKNVLGVLVNAPPGTHNDFYAATTGLNTCPTIINCTFTFNMIGIWNGQLASQSSVGVTPLNLVNNIFDASETVSGNSGNATWPCENLRVRQFNPSWPAFLPLHLGNPTAGTTATPITTIQTTTGIISDFEGISQADLRTVVGTTPVDFNAYELGVAIPPQIPLRPFAYNLGLPMGSAFCTLPVTRPRLNPYGNPNNTTFNPDPARDIGPITGWLGNSLGNARGVLYISDLICHGRVPQTVNGVTFAPFPPDWNDRTYDGSLHDVRLSPIASLAPIPPSGQTSAPAFDNLTGLLLNRLPNPLVDTGYSGPFPAQMENGFAIPRIPGTLSLNAASQVTWQHNCWEADCEGYGNPRIHDHPDYVLTPNPAEGGIDVGADEVGELIVAGYRFGTTSFLGLPVNHPDNTGPSSTVAVDNTNEQDPIRRKSRRGIATATSDPRLLPDGIS